MGWFCFFLSLWKNIKGGFVSRFWSLNPFVITCELNNCSQVVVYQSELYSKKKENTETKVKVKEHLSTQFSLLWCPFYPLLPQKGKKTSDYSRSSFGRPPILFTKIFSFGSRLVIVKFWMNKCYLILSCCPKSTSTVRGSEIIVTVVH